MYFILTHSGFDFRRYIKPNVSHNVSVLTSLQFRQHCHWREFCLCS